MPDGPPMAGFWPQKEQTASIEAVGADRGQEKTGRPKRAAGGQAMGHGSLTGWKDRVTTARNTPSAQSVCRTPS